MFSGSFACILHIKSIFNLLIYKRNEGDVFLLPQNVGIDVSTSWNMRYKIYDSKNDDSISVHLLRISLTKSERIIIVFKLRIKESFLKYYEVIKNGMEWSNLIKLYDRFDRIWSPHNTLRILPYYFSTYMRMFIIFSNWTIKYYKRHWWPVLDHTLQTRFVVLH